MHRFDEAAAAFGNYVNLLPNQDRSEKAAWARAEIRFLQSFRIVVPFDMGGQSEARTWTVPITHSKRQGGRAKARSTAAARTSSSIPAPSTR